MKDQIAAKLKGISNLEDRLILKSVLNEVFLQLYDHSSTMYGQLEERVFAEMEAVPHCYDIYTTAVLRRNFDPVHDFLRPMQSEDLAEKQYNLASIREAVLARQPFPLTKVFFSCPYPKLQQIFTGNRVFQGHIITDKGSTPAAFTIRQDRSYLNQIEKLYETFLNNEIPWKTMNHPYIFRFAQIVLESCEQLPEQCESIKKVVVDFAEFGPYVQYDVVPLWNVETLELRSNGFPIPCGDKINFEHIVNLDGSGAQHGYLTVFQNDPICYSHRTEHALIITAPADSQNTWTVMMIIHPASVKGEQLDYPLVSNAKHQAFTELLSQRSRRIIRTEAELRRLVASFVAAEGLELDHIELVPRDLATAAACESYEMNFFIMDEIRRADYQRKLVCYFTTTDKDNFLIYDVMSFVVSEVQRHYPDYKCEGILL
ncbi:hypothetical protein Ga0466249_004538 [Sporomusaceae bacterium BoRhaA]|uniref:hypothetical protein n=1 Tax=Pelorhabdus rhamnosifermentans TaxID=2772457 RepID=UPI001C05F136|nr:hypothetical protein [Pelorhabdus rhamnosifermentans]MBU2703393.1 hypothetical protein [Pelorhabdus rhamnosifermentans]